MVVFFAASVVINLKAKLNSIQCVVSPLIEAQMLVSGYVADVKSFGDILNFPGDLVPSSPAAAPISLEDIMKALLANKSEIQAQISERATKREIAEIQAQIYEIQSYYVDSSIPMTPSHYGFSLLEEAEKPPSIISSFVQLEGEAAIFDSLFSFSGESGGKQLVAKVYKRIQELLGDRRLVSSETTAWLETKKGKPCFNKNPDLICLHKAYVHFKKIREDGVVCGVPEHKCLCKNLFIFDVKTSPGHESFGEFAIHIRYLRLAIIDHCKCKETIESRGALMHNQGIWMVRFLDTTPREIIKMLWTDEGSVSKFQEFFCAKDEMGLVLDEVCKKLHHDIADHSKESSPPCFLGAGGTGKVFRVSPKASVRDTRAVKIVLGHQNIDFLRHESEMMTALKGTELAVEFVNMHVITKNGADLGAGLVMEPVGIPISKCERTLSYLPEALRVLSKIHLNEVYHGDPRVQNILLCKDKIRFCDFRDFDFAGIDNRIKAALDIEILLSSFEVKLNHELQGKIDQYAEDETERKIDELIAAITDKHQ